MACLVDVYMAVKKCYQIDGWQPLHSFGRGVLFESDRPSIMVDGAKTPMPAKKVCYKIHMFNEIGNAMNAPPPPHPHGNCYAQWAGTRLQKYTDP